MWLAIRFLVGVSKDEILGEVANAETDNFSPSLPTLPLIFRNCRALVKFLETPWRIFESPDDELFEAKFPLLSIWEEHMTKALNRIKCAASVTTVSADLVLANKWDGWTPSVLARSWRMAANISSLTTAALLNIFHAKHRPARRMASGIYPEPARSANPCSSLN